MITIIIINIIKITLMMMMMIKVLSYMEDHLKNKQRLEQEWVGLCAYEAEPNSTAIAFKVDTMIVQLMKSFTKKILLLLQLNDDDHETHHDDPSKRWRTRRRTVIRTSFHTTTTEFSSMPWQMGPIQTTSMLQLWSARFIYLKP